MKELSLIIQGASGTPEYPFEAMMLGLTRLRELFPLAEIILSTWQWSGERLAQNEETLRMFDIKLVQNQDPGPLEIRDRGCKYRTNINRMLISSQAGLNAATRPLAVKIRSDCFLTGRRIVELINNYVLNEALIKREKTFSVFSKRIITASWFSRDARGSLPFLFHPGDIFLAGRTEDLQLYFSAPLVTTSVFAPASAPGLWCAWRYVPEQWLWVNAIFKRHHRWVFEGNFSTEPCMVGLSERYFLANFVVFNPRELNLRWPKYWKRYAGRGLFSIYNRCRWLQLYSRIYSEPNGRGGNLLSYNFTFLWRSGYRVRSRLLAIPFVRRIALNLFTYR